jgi:transposase
MEEILSVPDKNLEIISVTNDTDFIEVGIRSMRKKARCPYCGEWSMRIHSYYIRTVYDLPIQGKKVKLILNNRKYFCNNPDCPQTTFAEKFDFYQPKATKTNRLQKEILETALTQSSITASRYLRNHVANVGKSTLCNLLKKKRNRK